MTREEWAQQSATRWPWLYELAKRFIEGANELLQDAEIQAKDSLLVMRALLFGRVITGTEALVALAKAGFSTEADVLFRSNLEALFRLAALVEKPSLLVPYMGEDFPRRRQAMNDIRKLLAPLNPRPNNVVSEEELDTAIEKIDQETTKFRLRHGVERVREMKIWEWVVAGKQFDFFYGKYLMHSNAAHHAARDLERRIARREDGQGVDSISIGIEDKPPIGIVLDALLLLARGIDAYARSVNREISQSLLAAGTELDQRYATELVP